MLSDRHGLLPFLSVVRLITLESYAHGFFGYPRPELTSFDISSNSIVPEHLTYLLLNTMKEY